jgi:hypothetical protein
LLWAVQTLDRKWLLLQKRKVALEMYYEKRFDDEKRRIDDVTRQELNTQLYNSIIVALKDTKSEKEVEDVDAKFNLHFLLVKWKKKGSLNVQKGNRCIVFVTRQGYGKLPANLVAVLSN